MRSIIQEAFIQSIKDTLEMIPRVHERKLASGYLSNIEIMYEDGSKNSITFVASLEFLKFFSEALFGDGEPDDLALQDLSKELANLIAGVSKLIASKKGIHFKIGIPTAFGFGEFQDSNCYRIDFVLDNTQCSLYMHNT